MSGRHVVALQQVLGQLQSAFGTAETDLSAADILEVLEGAKIGFSPNSTPVNLLGAGFSQNASVIGPATGDITMSFPLRTGGIADSTGQWTGPLQCCGLKSVEATDVYTYTPTSLQSEYKDMTIWGFSGSKDTTESFKRVIHSCMFNAKFTLDFRPEEAYGKVEFTGKGVFDLAATLASQVSPTKSTASILPIKGATINFLGDTDLDLLLFELDIGNEIVVVPKPSVATGLGYSLISKRISKWNAIVYKDGDANPMTTYAAGTLGTISISWGAKPNKITIATGASKAQITEINDGDQDGIETDELAGIIIDNNFTVAIDTAAAA